MIKILLSAPIFSFSAIYGQEITDLQERNFGPSKGRIPMDYAKEILGNLEDESVAKQWCELSIRSYHQCGNAKRWC